MLYFPTPYPDELLGSLLIRACHHLGLTPAALIRLLADGSSDLFFLYPSFFNGISRLTRVPAQELLLNHTVFPYLAIGLSTERRSVLERELLTASARGNSVRLRATLGLHIELLSCRRYCEQCCHEDRDRLGESYWHTQHMLPGVFVCPRHEETLHISSVSVLPKLSTGNAKLPQEVTGRPGNWGLDARTMKRLGTTVIDAMHLSAHTWDAVAADYSALTSSFAAARAQYPWNVDPMVADFGRFYGLAFLDRIGLGLESLGTDAWPARLLRGAHPTLLLQLRHLLLRLFLQSAGQPRL